MQVVNDVAERLIGVEKRYNFRLTRDEAEHQGLLQVVLNHCRDHPSENQKRSKISKKISIDEI